MSTEGKNIGIIEATS